MSSTSIKNINWLCLFDTFIKCQIRPKLFAITRLYKGEKFYNFSQTTPSMLITLYPLLINSWLYAKFDLHICNIGFLLISELAMKPIIK